MAFVSSWEQVTTRRRHFERNKLVPYDHFEVEDTLTVFAVLEDLNVKDCELVIGKKKNC